MKKLYIICLFLLCGLAATAQDFEIVSVERLDNSLQAANDRVTESGKEGRDCALLRIATQNITPQQRESFDFVPDMGSKIERRVSRDGEIWLWVTPGLRYLAIKSDLLGNRELSVLDYDINIQSLKTYKIIIRGTMMSDNVQYLEFKISPADAVLEIDGQKYPVDSEGTALCLLDLGIYHYRVTAPEYSPSEGVVTLDLPRDKKVLMVQLQPKHGSYNEIPKHLQDVAAPDTSIDLEQFGFCVKVILAHPYTTLLPLDDYSDKEVKRGARSYRENGWELQDSHRTLEEALERIMCAEKDENVVVLNGKAKAPNLEQGWHNAYSLAVLQYLGHDSSLNFASTWNEGDYESFIKELGDQYTVLGWHDNCVEAYKYDDSDGLIFMSYNKPSDKDDSSAMSLMEGFRSTLWDFESVEKAKKVVASGDSFTFYRKLKDSETGQTTYEVETVFIVEAPQF